MAQTLGGPIPQPDQFSGSLLGQCLGDALGFPVEGRSPAVGAEYVAHVLNGSAVVPPGSSGYAAGQYTDDSQLARELLRSYLALGRFDPAGYAGRIATLFKERRIVGAGAATRAAAMRLLQGVSWQHAGTPPPAAGNGSAMRAGPVGLLYFDDADALIQAARVQGRITHQDPRCSAGAVAIAGAVALAARAIAAVRFRPGFIVERESPVLDVGDGAVRIRATASDAAMLLAKFHTLVAREGQLVVRLQVHNRAGVSQLTNLPRVARYRLKTIRREYIDRGQPHPHPVLLA